MGRTLRAFSIVEILIAFLILAVLFITIMSTMNFGTRATLESVDKMVASNILFSILESVENHSFKYIKNNLSLFNYTDIKKNDPTASHRSYYVSSSVIEKGKFLLLELEVKWNKNEKILKLGKILSENEI